MAASVASIAGDKGCLFVGLGSDAFFSRFFLAAPFCFLPQEILANITPPIKNENYLFS